MVCERTRAGVVRTKSRKKAVCHDLQTNTKLTRKLGTSFDPEGEVIGNLNNP
jgi:hypothetical protein